MKSSMTAIGPCSHSSAALLAPTRAMVMIGATVMPASPSARQLPCRSAILDGEVIVQDALGVSDFEALQAALRSQPAQLIFYAFDLLHLDGKDLREKPLIERRTKLKRLIEQDPDNRIQFSAAAFF